MGLYLVRLDSQTDDQYREMTVEADSPAVAKALARRKEHQLVAFSVVPAPLEEPERPKDSADAEVWDQYLNAVDDYNGQRAQHEDRVKRAEADLEALRLLYTAEDNGHVIASDVSEREAHEATGSGVVRSRRARAHFHAHHQELPYEVSDCQPVIPSIPSTIDALKRLHEHPEHWAKTVQAMKDAGIETAAVTGALAGLTWQKQLDGSSVTVWSSATIQISLHTGYTFNNDTHDFFDDASASEITGTGYTANGVTLSSKTSTYDTATDQIRLDAADVSWTTSTLSATDAVIWVNTAGASSTDPILGNIDFGATVTTTAGTFAITFDATGILVFDVT